VVNIVDYPIVDYKDCSGYP